MPNSSSRPSAVTTRAAAAAAAGDRMAAGTVSVATTAIGRSRSPAGAVTQAR